MGVINQLPPEILENIFNNIFHKDVVNLYKTGSVSLCATITKTPVDKAGKFTSYIGRTKGLHMCEDGFVTAIRPANAMRSYFNMPFYNIPPEVVRLHIYQKNRHTSLLNKELEKLENLVLFAEYCHFSDDIPLILPSSVRELRLHYINIKNLPILPEILRILRVDNIKGCNFEDIVNLRRFSDLKTFISSSTSVPMFNSPIKIIRSRCFVEQFLSCNPNLILESMKSFLFCNASFNSLDHLSPRSFSAQKPTYWDKTFSTTGNLVLGDIKSIDEFQCLIGRCSQITSSSFFDEIMMSASRAKSIVFSGDYKHSYHLSGMQNLRKFSSEGTVDSVHNSLVDLRCRKIPRSFDCKSLKIFEYRHSSGKQMVPDRLNVSQFDYLDIGKSYDYSYYGSSDEDGDSDDSIETSSHFCYTKSTKTLEVEDDFPLYEMNLNFEVLELISNCVTNFNLFPNVEAISLHPDISYENDDLYDDMCDEDDVDCEEVNLDGLLRLKYFKWPCVVTKIPPSLTALRCSRIAMGNGQISVDGLKNLEYMSFWCEGGEVRQIVENTTADMILHVRFSEDDIEVRDFYKVDSEVVIFARRGGILDVYHDE